MAHKIHEQLSRLEGTSPKKCTDECEYFKFPHLPCACVLSEVFSVNKNELCYTFKERSQSRS